MSTRVVSTGLIAALLCGSCAVEAPPPRSVGAADTFQEVAAAPAAYRDEGATGMARPAPRQEQLPIGSMWAQQKRIRSGDLRIEVGDVEQALARADTLARERGAIVADLQAARTERGRWTARLVIRVPADRFSEMMESLQTLGEVQHEAATTEDVTRAYADLEIRLAVKERTAARLQRLLTDRTGRLSDVLEVERELGRVISEIEQMKGERRYYDARIAVSSITVALMEPAAVLVAGSTAPIAQAFRRSIQVLSTSASWLVYLVTFLAPWAAVAGAGWGTVRIVRRRRSAAAR